MLYTPIPTSVSTKVDSSSPLTARLSSFCRFIVQERLLGGDDTIEEVVVLSHHVLHLWIIARPQLSSKSVNYDAQLYLSERQLLTFHSEIGDLFGGVVQPLTR